MTWVEVMGYIGGKLRLKNTVNIAQLHGAWFQGGN